VCCFFFEKTSSLVKTATVFLVGFSFIFGLFYPQLIKAEDYTSPSFILRAPVITIEGGRVTAPTFEYISSSGQTVTGESTSPGFILRQGFLYFEEAAVPPPPPPPPGGGVGGGTASVSFSGRAYPQSTVILLKDGQIAITTLSDAEANFQISIPTILAGNYIFGLYAKDSEEIASSLVTIPVSLKIDKATNISGIFISPTITTDKSEVKKDEDILISGQSAPEANIQIFIKSEEKSFSVNTIAGKDGKYNYSLNTSSLDFGEYQVTVVASIDSISSNVSRIINFIVGTKTVFKKPLPECPLKADLNDDCQVDLIDFSILIYWFGRPDPPTKVDLDGNRLIDLVDFSIMAYYWTG